MEVQIFGNDLFSGKFLPHEYHKNKLLTKLNRFTVYEPQHDKTNKMSVRPAKTQISLGIRCLRCPHEETLGPNYPMNAQADLSLR